MGAGQQKAEHRKGRVQLIDASQWFAPLRRNLGKKNCELAEGDIRRILDLYLGEAQETDSSTDQSKWFDTQDFGYWKITVERPLRLKSQLKTSAIDTLRFASGDEELRTEIYAEHGDKLYTSFAKLKPEIEAWLKGGSEDDDDAEDGDEEGTHAKKAVPEKRRRGCSMPRPGNATRGCSIWRCWRRRFWVTPYSMTTMSFGRNSI